MNALRRHWLRFILGALFAAVILLTGWLGHQLSWMRERHAFLTETVNRFGVSADKIELKRQIDKAGELLVVDETAVPWSLRLLGEKESSFFFVPSRSYPDLASVQRLFPFTRVTSQSAAKFMLSAESR